MSEIIDIRAYPLDLKLKNAFETAKGRKTTSPAVVVEFMLSNGKTALGSATPVKYVTGEDIESVLNSVNDTAPILKGKDISSYRPLFEILADILPNQHSARAGLEMAVLDGFCKEYNLPMCNFFGGKLSQIETDVTIPITDPQNARQLAKEASEMDFNHLKIKVGGDPEDDMARVLAVSQGVPECDVILDANQGFTPEIAVEFIEKLQAHNVKINMLEQPVAFDDFHGLKYVTEKLNVPVFADESAVTPANVLQLIKMDAVDGINIKLMKSGISGALDIIAITQAAGKELMLGSMIETGIGLATSVHFASGTGVFSRLDLDAHLLASEEPFVGGFSYQGAKLEVDTNTPGHGSIPS